MIFKIGDKVVPGSNWKKYERSWPGGYSSDITEGIVTVIRNNAVSGHPDVTILVNWVGSVCGQCYYYSPDELKLKEENNFKLRDIVKLRNGYIDNNLFGYSPHYNRGIVISLSGGNIVKVRWEFDNLYLNYLTSELEHTISKSEAVTLTKPVINLKEEKVPVLDPSLYKVSLIKLNQNT